MVSEHLFQSCNFFAVCRGFSSFSHCFEVRLLTSFREPITCQLLNLLLNSIQIILILVKRAPVVVHGRDVPISQLFGLQNHVYLFRLNRDVISDSICECFEAMVTQLKLGEKLPVLSVAKIVVLLKNEGVFSRVSGEFYVEAVFG